MEQTINLARMYYPVRTLGPGDRVGIWLAGCDRRCPGCISPELQSSGAGRAVRVDEVIGYITRLCDTACGFTISGGEPFLHPDELKSLIYGLYGLLDDIIIFTGYTLDELELMRDDDVDYVLEHISVLIDGPYRKELSTDRGLRGSSNQTIHIFKHFERYKDLVTCERSLQVVVADSRVMTIGIP